MSRIYLFDGSGGCDFCKEATGYSIDEEPIRPHPACDCPIFEIDPADLPECELVLKNLIIDESDLISEERHGVFDTCDETTDIEITIRFNEAEQEDFDEGLQELVEASGWARPPTDHLSDTVTLEEGWIHMLNVSVERHVAIFEAQVSYACTVNGERVEIPGGQKTGFYEKSFRLDIQTDRESCPVQVPDLADDEALASYLGGEDDEDTG